MLTSALRAARACRKMAPTRCSRRVSGHRRRRFLNPLSYGLRRTGARHDQWTHAGIHLARHPVDLYHMGDAVETAGLALHDEVPERMSRLIDETLADFLIGMGGSRIRGKC